MSGMKDGTAEKENETSHRYGPNGLSNDLTVPPANKHTIAEADGIQSRKNPRLANPSTAQQEKPAKHNVVSSKNEHDNGILQRHGPNGLSEDLTVSSVIAAKVEAKTAAKTKAGAKEGRANQSENPKLAGSVPASNPKPESAGEIYERMHLEKPASSEAVTERTHRRAKLMEKRRAGPRADRASPNVMQQKVSTGHDSQNSAECAVASASSSKAAEEDGAEAIGKQRKKSGAANKGEKPAGKSTKPKDPHRQASRPSCEQNDIFAEQDNAPAQQGDISAEDEEVSEQDLPPPFREAMEMLDLREELGQKRCRQLTKQHTDENHRILGDNAKEKRWVTLYANIWCSCRHYRMTKEIIPKVKKLPTEFRRNRIWMVDNVMLPEGKSMHILDVDSRLRHLTLIATGDPGFYAKTIVQAAAEGRISPEDKCVIMWDQENCFGEDCKQAALKVGFAEVNDIPFEKWRRLGPVEADHFNCRRANRDFLSESKIDPESLISLIFDRENSRKIFERMKSTRYPKRDDEDYEQKAMAVKEVQRRLNLMPGVHGSPYNAWQAHELNPIYFSESESDDELIGGIYDDPITPLMVKQKKARERAKLLMNDKLVRRQKNRADKAKSWRPIRKITNLDDLKKSQLCRILRIGLNDDIVDPDAKSWEMQGEIQGWTKLRNKVFVTNLDTQVQGVYDPSDIRIEMQDNIDAETFINFAHLMEDGNRKPCRPPPHDTAERYALPPPDPDDPDYAEFRRRVKEKVAAKEAGTALATLDTMMFKRREPIEPKRTIKNTTMSQRYKLWRKKRRGEIRHVRGEVERLPGSCGNCGSQNHYYRDCPSRDRAVHATIQKDREELRNRVFESRRRNDESIDVTFPWWPCLTKPKSRKDLAGNTAELKPKSIFSKSQLPEGSMLLRSPISRPHIISSRRPRETEFQDNNAVFIAEGRGDDEVVVAKEPRRGAKRQGTNIQAQVEQTIAKQEGEEVEYCVPTPKTRAKKPSFGEDADEEASDVDDLQPSQDVTLNSDADFSQPGRMIPYHRDVFLTARRVHAEKPGKDYWQFLEVDGQKICRRVHVRKRRFLWVPPGHVGGRQLTGRRVTHKDGMEPCEDNWIACENGGKGRKSYVRWRGCTDFFVKGEEEMVVAPRRADTPEKVEASVLFTEAEGNSLLNPKMLKQLQSKGDLTVAIDKAENWVVTQKRECNNPQEGSEFERILDNVMTSQKIDAMYTGAEQSEKLNSFLLFTSAEQSEHESKNLNNRFAPKKELEVEDYAWSPELCKRVWDELHGTNIVLRSNNMSNSLIHELNRIVNRNPEGTRTELYAKAKNGENPNAHVNTTFTQLRCSPPPQWWGRNTVRWAVNKRTGFLRVIQRDQHAGQDECVLYGLAEHPAAFNISDFWDGKSGTITIQGGWSEIETKGLEHLFAPALRDEAEMLKTENVFKKREVSEGNVSGPAENNHKNDNGQIIADIKAKYERLRKQAEAKKAKKERKKTGGVNSDAQEAHASDPKKEAPENPQDPEYVSLSEEDLRRGDKNAILSKIVYVLKVDLETGKLIKAKARWVGRGDLDRDRDYCIGRADMCSDTGINAGILWMCHAKRTMGARFKRAKSDVPAAYLKGERLKREVYLKIPAEVQKLVPGLDAPAIRLDAALYGLRESGRLWQKKWAACLAKRGIYPTGIDMGLYVQTRDKFGAVIEKKQESLEEIVRMREAILSSEFPNVAINGEIVGVAMNHVDDIFWGGSEEFDADMRACCEEFQAEVEEIKDGEPAHFLGRLFQFDGESASISMIKYAQELKEVDKDDVVRTNQRKTNAPNRFIRSSIKCPIRTSLGELNWIAKCRMDISASAGLIASAYGKLSHKILSSERRCWEDHRSELSDIIDDLNKIADHVRETAELTQLQFTAPLPWKHDSPWPFSNTPMLVGFGDASGASPHRVGTCIILVGHKNEPSLGPSDWRTKKAGENYHKYVVNLLHFKSKCPGRTTPSSTGGELIANCYTANELTYVKQFLVALGLMPTGQGAVQLSDSNNSMAGPPAQANLKADFNFVAKLQEENRISLCHVPGKFQIADVLTKKLSDAEDANVHYLQMQKNGFLPFSLERVLQERRGAHGSRPEPMCVPDQQQKFE